MTEHKVMIGLEVHVQLATLTKLFCGCLTQASEPNSSVCEVCLGMPGSKPVLNKKALDFALKIALALDCEINKQFFFSRKTYFYPDMSKNYQISQYETPVGKKGFVKLKSGKKIGIRRVHLEEDPAALVHGAGIHASAFTMVDYNRSGMPLVEIVSEPDLSSPEEAREYVDKLILTLGYLGVFNAGVETLKADCNISVDFGKRAEIKNVNGLRAVEKALAFEIGRQKAVVERGEKVVMETRSFDDKTRSTKSLRSKDTEEDYGYIFDPDLVMVELSAREIEEARKALPELFEERTQRFVSDYGLDAYTAEVLASNFVLSNLFQEIVGKASPKIVAAFLTRELLAILNRDNLSLEELSLSPEAVWQLLELLEKGKITEKNAKEAMIAYVNQKILPIDFIKKNGLLKDLGENEALGVVERVMNANPQAVQDLKSGEKKAMNFLVGLVMRETKGKVDARTVQKIIEEKL